MQIIDTDATRRALAFEPVIATLRAAFAGGYTVPPRHVHSIVSGDRQGTSLIMPAWSEAGYFGVKVINIFPENTRDGLPGLHATYTLYSARNGVPLAQVDGDVVTAFRTAGAAALGADYLARRDARRLLVLGSGRIAGLLPAAMKAVRPIEEVLVWNVRPEARRPWPGVWAKRALPRPPSPIWRPPCARPTSSAAPRCPRCRWCAALGCGRAPTWISSAVSSPR